jgi:hypothetical protein
LLRVAYAESLVRLKLKTGVSRAFILLPITALQLPQPSEFYRIYDKKEFPILQTNKQQYWVISLSLPLESGIPEALSNFRHPEIEANSTPIPLQSLSLIETVTIQLAPLFVP